uniref:Uncharacterized protein n=1 Tax=Phenylobacterium glaciei TaxID=2803784 RepID=A0A974SAI1_9CAUL|nr:hypothetical protein JKL49_13120 [Phenylobacterium glaciei]
MKEGITMSVLRDDIAAFDRMRTDLEAEHRNEWVVFHHGEFVDAFLISKPPPPRRSTALVWGHT